MWPTFHATIWDISSLIGSGETGKQYPVHEVCRVYSLSLPTCAKRVGGRYLDSPSPMRTSILL